MALRYPVKSVYLGCEIYLITKHAKALAIAPVFKDLLGANVIEYHYDTDKFGTFSGEVLRVGTALDCVQKKCETIIHHPQLNCQFALASEGSFGPHPSMPMVSCDHETLYFVDLNRNFKLHVSHISTVTNYSQSVVHSFEALKAFADKSLFPSHALIIHAKNKEAKELIYKNICDWDMLKYAYHTCEVHSDFQGVSVQTDMRANYNPSRMRVIEQTALKLANRLACHCPKCQCPGFGLVDIIQGLPCRWCDLPTSLVKNEVFACIQCEFKEVRPRLDGLTKAEPGDCVYCNP